MVVKDAKPNFPRLLSLHEALGEIGRPQTQWNEKWLKRTIKNNGSSMDPWRSQFSGEF